MDKYSISFYFLFIVVVAVGFGALVESEEELDNYVMIEVQSGDSLWNLSKQFQDYHSLSDSEFVNWVEEKNELIDEKIQTGERLIIPIQVEEEHVENDYVTLSGCSKMKGETSQKNGQHCTFLVHEE
ncbi:LysM peptidoglycan-binding domain-containing protein [Bacillus carboniphilus]|uniref:LysM peptidoglycan-binding domain-containing protein n=1 Tax=Bacillus carboniphilus TaxID=86663 RepID=A0ABY9JY48_9BACI|nr:LysM peptidoglycan-binding domain-containing protein [Bacillus carboniphilus]WLR43457.1 LysM peptidoglycan-binding domain-containing protein [Bacillus carboniphilus]